jgi:hypothetical protein
VIETGGIGNTGGQNSGGTAGANTGGQSSGGLAGSGGIGNTGGQNSGGASGAGPLDGGPDGGHVDGGDGPACDTGGDPTHTACLVDETFGVFVSPAGSSSGLGTRASPFKSFSQALTVAHSSGKRVYACDGDYSESLDIGTALDGSSVYGGFSCADWSYDGGATIVTSTAHGVAHRVHDLSTGIVMNGLELRALDGVAAGESSMALLVANTTGPVRLRGTKLVAGKGARGSNGAPGTAGILGLLPGQTSAEDGEDAACSLTTHGAGGVRTCAGTGATTGGHGALPLFDVGGCDSEGNPYISLLGVGDPGSPYGAPGGNFDYINDQFLCYGFLGVEGFTCRSGSTGIAGADGSLGIGATGTGALDATGWIGIRGGDGGDGKIGGGGGGASAPYECRSTSDVFGNHLDCVSSNGGGGGGGAGGCGAGGAKGGAPGGSSIALASVNATVSLDLCTLVASGGGDGGNGGDGALGQDGAPGGAGPIDETFCDPSTQCTGGGGGRGGHAGPGGGGAGGHSIGVAFVGTAPTTTLSTITAGAPGNAGLCGAAPAGYTGSGDPRECDAKPGRSSQTFSNWTAVATDSTPPTGAAITNIVSNTCRSLDLTWSRADDGAQGTPVAQLDYEVCWSTVRADCEGSPNFVVSRTLRDQTTTTISGLTRGTTYYAAVRAIDGAGNLGSVTTVSSLAVSTTQDLEAPAGPTGFSNGGVGTDQTAVSLSWSAASDDCTATNALVYETCIGSACATSGTWTATAPGASAATVTGLPACSLTSVSLRARDGAGKTSTPVSKSVRPTSNTACFALDVVPILQGCQTAFCHGGPPHPTTNHATLTSTNAACTSLKLVTPGNSAQSFIYQVMVSGSVCPNRPQMSSNATAADTVKRWIDQGALDN